MVLLRVIEPVVFWGLGNDDLRDENDASKVHEFPCDAVAVDV